MKLFKRSLLPSKLTTGGSVDKSDKDTTRTDLDRALSTNPSSTTTTTAENKLLLSVGSEPTMSKHFSKSQGQFDDGIVKRAEKSFGGFFKAAFNKNETTDNKKKGNTFSNSFKMTTNSGELSNCKNSSKLITSSQGTLKTGVFLTLPNHLNSPDDQQRLSNATSNDENLSASGYHSQSQGDLELSPSPNAQNFDFKQQQRRDPGEKSLDDLSADVLGYIISFLPNHLDLVKEHYKDSYRQLLEIRRKAKFSFNENGKSKIEILNNGKQKKALKKLLYSRREATRSFGIFSLCFTRKYFYEELFERVSFWQTLCEVCNKIDLRTWDAFCSQLADKSHDDKGQIEMWQNIYRYHNEYSARWENNPEFVHSVFKITQNDLKIKRNCKKSKVNTSQLDQSFEYKEEFKSLLHGGHKKDSLCAISSNSFVPGNLYYVECICKFNSISSRLAIGVMPDSDCFFKEPIHDPSTASANTALDYSFTSFDDSINSPLKNIRNSLNISSSTVHQQLNGNNHHSKKNVHSPFNPKEYTSPDMLCLSMLENMEDSQLFLSGDRISIIIDYNYSEKNVLKLYYCNNWDSSKERTTFTKSMERIKLYERTRGEGKFTNYLPQNLPLQDDRVLNYLIKDEISQIPKECKKSTTSGGGGVNSSISSHNSSSSSTDTTNNENCNLNQPFEDRINEPFRKYSSRHIYFLSKYRNSTEQHYQYPKGYKSNARKEIISFCQVEERNESEQPIKSLSSAFDPTKERPTICTADLYLPNLKLCMSSQEVGDSVKIIKPSLPYPPFFYHLLLQGQNQNQNSNTNSSLTTTENSTSTTNC